MCIDPARSTHPQPLERGVRTLGGQGAEEVGRYCWRRSPSLICFCLVPEVRWLEQDQT